jgi:hypothetical protein
MRLMFVMSLAYGAGVRMWTQPADFFVGLPVSPSPMISNTRSRAECPILLPIFSVIGGLTNVDSKFVFEFTRVAIGSSQSGGDPQTPDPTKM